jgi:hypothetical protein
LRGDGVRAEQPQRFPPFEELEVSGFLEAHIQVATPSGGPAPRDVMLSLTGDSNLIERADLRIIGRRLLLSGGASLPPKVEPALGVLLEGRLPNLDLLALRDQAIGTVAALRNEEFQVRAEGASQFSLERVDNDRIVIAAGDDAAGIAQGYTKQLTLIASGAANVQAHRLRAQDAVIELYDGATATICVTGTLEVRAQGDALVVKFCDPARLLSDKLDSDRMRDPTLEERRAASDGAPRIDVRARPKRRDDAPAKAAKPAKK